MLAQRNKTNLFIDKVFNNIRFCRFLNGGINDQIEQDLYLCIPPLLEILKGILLATPCDAELYVAI